MGSLPLRDFSSSLRDCSYLYSRLFKRQHFTSFWIRGERSSEALLHLHLEEGEGMIASVLERGGGARVIELECKTSLSLAALLLLRGRAEEGAREGDLTREAYEVTPTIKVSTLVLPPF